jgi:hypothetical protein
MLACPEQLLHVLKRREQTCCVYRPLDLYSTDFAACAVCFSLRAAFRVCHDLLSVFGLGFSFLCDSRAGGAVVDAMFPHFSAVG